MKKSFRDMIKSIVATSVAAIAGTHGADAAPDYRFNEAPDNSNVEENHSIKKD